MLERPEKLNKVSMLGNLAENIEGLEKRDRLELRWSCWQTFFPCMCSANIDSTSPAFRPRTRSFPRCLDI